MPSRQTLISRQKSTALHHRQIFVARYLHLTVVVMLFWFVFVLCFILQCFGYTSFPPCLVFSFTFFVKAAFSSYSLHLMKSSVVDFAFLRCTFCSVSVSFISVVFTLRQRKRMKSIVKLQLLSLSYKIIIFT